MKGGGRLTREDNRQGIYYRGNRIAIFITRLFEAIVQNELKLSREHLCNLPATSYCYFISVKKDDKH